MHHVSRVHLGQQVLESGPLDDGGRVHVRRLCQRHTGRDLDTQALHGVRKRRGGPLHAQLRPGCYSFPQSYSMRLARYVVLRLIRFHKQGTYMRTDCALDADAVCAPCTPTPPGYLTTTPCGERTDTVRGACPPSMACYGGVASAQCPTPRLVRGGRCVCPNATEAASDGDPCLPFACPQVLFSPLWLPL